MTTAALVDHWPRLSVHYAWLRSRLTRRALPPGEWISIDRLERSRRTLLMDLQARHGPVFKGLSEDRLIVCVVGIAACRQLLREHGTALQPTTLDLQSLFPKGFLRQMQGDDHRHYRQALMRAIRADDLAASAATLEAIAAAELARWLRADDGRAYTAAMSRIATGMLLRCVFGTDPDTPLHERLMDGFHELGPHGLVWNLTLRQRRAFGHLRDELRGTLARTAAPGAMVGASSVLGRLAAAGPVDDTMLGNLIYMVEMGRYDLRGLFRWLMKYAADRPDLVERIADEDTANASPAHRLRDAFVLETLRMDQSERLMRRVQRDIVFQGLLIPRFATLRLCMWEAHKAPSFERPFEFDPTRFINGSPQGDQFSPFGLDDHRCPFAAISLRAGAALLDVLARSYRLSARGDGPAVRGAYHWEPAPGLTLTLQARRPVPAVASPWTCA